MKFSAIFILVFLTCQGFAQDTLRISEESSLIKELEFNTSSNILYSEISRLKTLNDLTEYLYEHAAKESDFDSLYQKISGKRADTSITEDMLKGRFKKGEINSLYLFLIGRNYRLLGNSKETTNGNFMLLKDHFKAYLEQAENRKNSDFSADFSKGNFHRFGTSYFMNHESKFNGTITTIKKQLQTDADHLNEFYTTNQVEKANQNEPVFEFFFIDTNIGLPGFIPKNEIEKFIKGYISSQVFKDIIFVWINGKFVWFDVES